MKSILLVVLLFSFSFQLSAQTKQQEIMNNLFNGNISDAGTAIDEHIAINPEHPKYYLLNAHFNFYMRYFDNVQHDRDSVIQVIIDNAETAISWGEKYRPTTELKFYIGSAYGFLSRALVMRQDYWDGYWAAQECIDYLEEVLEEDPEYYDAYLALGINEYFPTRIGGFLSFMAGLGGMSGDLETAFEYITKASEKGSLFKDEATFVLATLFRIENDYPNAEKHYLQLREKFPGNNLVEVQYQQVRLAGLIEEKGVAHFEENLDNYRDEYLINSSAPLNNLGYNFVFRQQYDMAEPVFLLNLKLYPDEANPYDSISEFYETVGNNEQAVKYAKKGLEILPADSTANEDTKELLRGLMEERIENLSSSI